MGMANKVMCKEIRRAFLWLSLLPVVWLGTSGCSNISLQSNVDAAAVHKVNRIFILIKQDDLKTQKLAHDLAADLELCFSNRPTHIEVAILSPLDLDDNSYNHRISAFDADSVLTISMRSVVVDPYGGLPTINYDASLFDPVTKKRLWRAAIVNSGSTDAMGRRMSKMVESIVTQLEHDGFL